MTVRKSVISDIEDIDVLQTKYKFNYGMINDNKEVVS